MYHMFRSVMVWALIICKSELGAWTCIFLSRSASVSLGMFFLSHDLFKSVFGCVLVFSGLLIVTECASGCLGMFQSVSICLGVSQPISGCVGLSGSVSALFIERWSNHVFEKTSILFCSTANLLRGIKTNTCIRPTNSHFYVASKYMIALILQHTSPLRRFATENSHNLLTNCRTLGPTNKYLGYVLAIFRICETSNKSISG